MRSIKKQLGTWFYDDGAWHLVTKDHNGHWTPGGLILDKTWEPGDRMRDFMWELEIWKEHQKDSGSYFKVTSIEKFATLKEGMEYADELFQAFV